MRILLLSATVALAAAGPAAQPAGVPVPPSVKSEGLPAIPERIAHRLAPYSEFGRASLLSWHPVRQQLLVGAVSGPVGQVHSVDTPGAAPRPITQVPQGVTGPAWYIGEAVVYRHDPTAKEAHQLWRLEPGGAEPVLITDGVSRNGIPAVSPRSGLLAFDSNRRNGKDRDL
jgi:hypothetical protein